MLDIEIDISKHVNPEARSNGGWAADIYGFQDRNLLYCRSMVHTQYIRDVQIT